MQEWIASIVAGVVAIPMAGVAIKIYADIEERKKRKEHLYFVQKRLHRIALKFRDECILATKTAIEQYPVVLRKRHCWHLSGASPYSFIVSYSNILNSLKEKYIGNCIQLYADGDNALRCEAEDLPSYILDEYCSEIEEIYQTFWEIKSHLWETIQKLIDENDSL